MTRNEMIEAGLLPGYEEAAETPTDAEAKTESQEKQPEPNSDL